MDEFFFETGIGVITLMLRFSLDLKQLPYPQHPPPPPPAQKTTTTTTTKNMCSNWSYAVKARSRSLLPYTKSQYERFVN